MHQLNRCHRCLERKPYTGGEQGSTTRRQEEGDMARRSGVLEYAILGLLRDAPMHGYELRKRLNGVLGSFRAISYGSLYPALRDLVERGLIIEAGAADASAPVLSGRRAKIVYELTADGKDRFAELVKQTGPEAW